MIVCPDCKHDWNYHGTDGCQQFVGDYECPCGRAAWDEDEETP